MREILASSISRLAPTMVNILIVAVAAGAVVMTAGSAAGSQQNVLKTIDSVGTRTIMISAPLSAGLDSGIVSRLGGIGGIAWVGAFGEAQDVTTGIGGNPVAARDMWSTDFTMAGIDGFADDGSFASTAASQEVGFSQASGQLWSVEGESITVQDTVVLPKFLSTLDPIVLRTKRADQGPVTLVVILAASPEQVGAVSELSLSMANVDDPAALKLKTSEQIALLRSAIDSDLGSFGHQIVVGSVVVTAVTVSSLLFGLVLMRRRDYGRRRALGASKRFIVLLIAGQSLLTAIGGATCGEAIATVVLEVSSSPVPPFSFSVAVWVLLVSAASAASLPPALVAASREPATELRVP